MAAVVIERRVTGRWQPHPVDLVEASAYRVAARQGWAGNAAGTRAILVNSWHYPVEGLCQCSQVVRRESITDKWAHTGRLAGQPADPKALMTTAEVAALFGVSAETIANWTDRGRVTVALRTPGGQRRYTRIEAEFLACEWLACRDWPDTAQLAAALKISREHATRLARQGHLPGAVKAIVGQWRIPHATFKAVTERRAASSKAAR